MAAEIAQIVVTQVAPAATSFTCPVDSIATLNSGDRLLLVFSQDGNAGIESTSMPTGWARITGGAGGTAAAHEVWEKLNCDGSEESFNFTLVGDASETAVYYLVRVTGSHATSAAEGDTATSANSDTPDPPPVTATWEEAGSLAIASYGGDDGDMTATAYPTGFDDNQNTHQSSALGGGQCSGAMCSRAYDTSSGELNPAAFTAGASDGWACSLVLIRPAAAGGGVTVTPTTAHLTVTGKAPTVSTPVAVTPTKASLTVTGYAPTVSTPVAVTPTTANLTVTAYAPTVSVSGSQIVTPTTAHLTITPYAPTVSTPVVVTPTTAHLTLTTYAPTVQTPIVVVPAKAGITITTYAPAIVLPILVTPGKASLTVTAYAPTISTGDEIAGPYTVAAAEVFQPGAVAGSVFQPGAVASDVFQPGAVAAEVSVQ